LRLSRSICSLGICCLLLGACADVPAGETDSYVVLPQDTLYSIAWRHDLDFRDLARWNNIGPDFRISVGQVLVLGPGRNPAPRPQPQPKASRPTNPSPSGSAPVVGKPQPLVTTPLVATPLVATPRSAPSSLPWVWPTDRLGAPRPVSGGGIILSGRLGQDVRAASAGRVVYTGSGLRGYGNLIIIKHADSLLSAYGHNREIVVHDGQEVTLGQVIAHMGEDAHQAPILYFEIRQNGRPVDPLAYLFKVK
jgi:lipoprotein NlpD